LLPYWAHPVRSPAAAWRLPKPRWSSAVSRQRGPAGVAPVGLRGPDQRP